MSQHEIGKHSFIIKRSRKFHVLSWKHMKIYDLIHSSTFRGNFIVKLFTQKRTQSQFTRWKKVVSLFNHWEKRSVSKLLLLRPFLAGFVVSLAGVAWRYFDCFCHIYCIFVQLNISNRSKEIRYGNLNDKRMNSKLSKLAANLISFIWNRIKNLCKGPK